jgi:broad specificity phosphatase PhoE
MAIIYLVRHGKTDFISKMLCGNLPGIPLNEEGRSQAQKTALYLSTLPIKAIYTSPIQRALETAGIIGEATGLDLINADFLREIHFGDLQGIMTTELISHPLWQRFATLPADVVFPNGESVVEVQKRVAEGLDWIAEQYNENDRVVCVAHSDVLRLAISWALGLPLDNFHRLSISPAGVSKLEWTPNHKQLRLLNFQPTCSFQSD